ncbi:MAG TPA: hypothetical protein VEZ72_24710, partial [Paenibacillus sp.]|nr:hypothetical protein [Paenibacillus sp.]
MTNHRSNEPNASASPAGASRPGGADRPMKSSEWVRADLERRLDAGAFAPGERLPSVDELS